MRYDRGHHQLETRYEAPGTGESRRQDRFASMDEALVKHIAPIVEELYPGHPWFISVEHQQGIIKINLPALMKQNYFVIKIPEIQVNPFELRRLVKKGCGEILERYNLPRLGYSHSDYLSALASRPLHRLRNDTLLPA